MKFKNKAALDAHYHNQMANRARVTSIILAACALVTLCVFLSPPAAGAGAALAMAAVVPVAQPEFKSAEEATAWFEKQGQAAESEETPTESPEEPHAETTEPKKPGPVANLFAGGALKEAQAKVAAAEARAAKAEGDYQKALTALNAAAAQNLALQDENKALKESIPMQVQQETIDTIASQGQQESSLPAADVEVEELTDPEAVIKAIAAESDPQKVAALYAKSRGALFGKHSLN